MSTTKNAPSKGFALVLNAVVAVLCAAAIAAYFFTPFFALKIAVKFTPELAETITKQVNGSSSGGDSADQQEIIAEVINQMGKDGVQISAGFTLKTTDVFAAFGSDGGKSAIDKIINDNVKSLMDELDETINKVVGSVAKTTVKTSIKTSIKDALGKNEDGTTKTIEADGKTYTVDEALEELGITDAFIGEQVDEIINSVMNDSVTVDEIADKMCDAIDNAYKQIASSDSEIKDKYLGSMSDELTGEEREQVKRDILNTLQELGVDSDSEINGEDILYTVIGNLIANADKNKENPEDDSEAASKAECFGVQIGTSAAVNLSDRTPETTGGASGGAENKTYTKEEVQQMIADKINAAITDDTRNALCTAMKIICYVIIFTFATWAWLIIKMIIKLFFKNPMIKLWLPLWFGNIPFWILCALPTLAFGVLFNFNSAPAFVKNPLTNLFGEEAINTITSLGNSIGVKVSSCALIPFIISAVMIVFCFIYCPARKRLKRQLRESKKL